MKKTQHFYATMINMNMPATRTEWWIIATLFFFPWIIFAPLVLVSMLFVPFFFMSLLSFVLSLFLIPLLFLITLVSIFACLQVLYVIVSLRRYKDLGKSGLWFFVIFIPVIGSLWQIVELGFIKGKIGHHS